MIKNPPWNLSGNGYIILYKFSNKFLQQNKIVPRFLMDSKVKGMGAIMYVDYQESDIGPYKELLFIPGKFSHNKRKLATISKIYVSTKVSVNNGIENWAIPKELAEFDHVLDNKSEIITIIKEEEEIAKFRFKPGLIPLPINTKFLPFPLVQKRKGKYYYTEFSGKGMGKISIIEEYKINGKYFPDVTSVTPVAVIKVENFKIRFSKAKIDNE